MPRAPVLADAAYGMDTRFREALRDLDLPYVVGIVSSLSVWPPGQGTATEAEAENDRTSSEIAAPGRGPSAGGSERPGLVVTGYRLEDHYLA